MHCFAHCLNLCLQEAGRKLVLLRDAIDTVQEIAKLIIFSPKRSNLLNEKLVQREAGHTEVSIRLLCPTRWAARSDAINAALKDY